MRAQLYPVAGATGLIAAAAVWILLHYFRVGGPAVFLLSALGIICSGIFLMHQAVLQRQRNEFGSFKNLLMACSWWFVAMLSLPFAMVMHFPILAGVR